MRLTLPAKKDYTDFIINNYLQIIIGLIIAVKTLAFNFIFHLTNSGVVPFVVVLVMSAVIFLPYLNRKKRYKQAFTLDVIISIILICDVIYLRYFGSLMSIQSVSLAGSATDVPRSIVNLLKPIDILFVIDLPFIYFAQRNMQKKHLGNLPKNNKTIFWGITLLLLSASVFIFVYDFDNVKLLTTKTFDNRVIAERYGMGAYHVLDIYSFTSTKFYHLSATEKKDIISKAKQHITKPETNSKTGLAKGKNLILLQVESLQTSVINQKVNGQEITPNINNFIKSSDYYNNHYFQLGNGGTSDSDFVVNSSLYPMKSASSFVQYGGDNYNGLASVLKQNGYSTTAYHAFNRSFWNRNVALKSLGYDKFLASESYDGFKKIQMGANDDDFLKKTVQEMKKEPTPSLSYVITLTSHHPFDLPEDEKSLKLPDNLPKNIANYYQAIHYTDRAVGDFLDLLKKDKILDDSVLVLYGDHSATYSSSLGDLNTKTIQEALGSNNENSNLKQKTELKRVPLIIHLPNQKTEILHTEVSGHIDIMPTLLNLFGIKAEIPMFGQDLNGGKDPYYAAVSYFDDGIIITKDKVYADGKIKGIENGFCYLIQGESWTPTNVSVCNDLVLKRDQEQNVSNKLIKYNLFKELK